MLLTIGHSNHEMETFIGLLVKNSVTAVADVRSSPYSRYTPQYNREKIRASLLKSGIAYTFLGKEFGARSDNPLCYKDGKVQYGLLSQQPVFFEGISRVDEGMQRYRIAFMCAEKDPIECHRALLVARAFFDRGTPVSHIHADGSMETHAAFESRLLTHCKMPSGDMFKSKADFILDAYLIQGNRVAYQDDEIHRNEVLAS